MQTVNSRETAEYFLRALVAAGLMYHPEESAYASLTHHGLPQCDLNKINANMAACHVYLPDPCETALELLAAVDSAILPEVQWVGEARCCL